MKITDEKQTKTTDGTANKVSNALELLVRMLGVVNGTITIHARGGQVLRGIEIVNKVDVLTVE